MHPYPHTYTVSAVGQVEGWVQVTAPDLPSLQTAPPPQFDGPGGVWSPETLLCAAVADCFILTFRSVSRVARFEWLQLDCRVDAVLERVGTSSRFTRYTTFAHLRIPEGGDQNKARQLLERAEHGCLVANSLNGARDLQLQVSTDSSVDAATS